MLSNLKLLCREILTTLQSNHALAEQFGVSRPSLREAIQKLTAKGRLISRQGGGNYVAE